MGLKRFLKMLFVTPNSAQGLIYRAELLEERAESMHDGIRDSEKLYRYASILRELSAKNWTPRRNKEFIKENLRNLQ